MSLSCKKMPMSLFHLLSRYLNLNYPTRYSVLALSMLARKHLNQIHRSTLKIFAMVVKYFISFLRTLLERLPSSKFILHYFPPGVFSLSLFSSPIQFLFFKVAFEFLHFLLSYHPLKIHFKKPFSSQQRPAK